MPWREMKICLTYIYTWELDTKQFAKSHGPFHQFWVCLSLLADTDRLAGPANPLVGF